MRFYCPKCRRPQVVPAAIVRSRQSCGLPVMCGACNTIMERWDPKSGLTDSQKRSRQQEKRAAKRVGGWVQPASGAGRAKGDVRVPGELRMECKFTRANSYSLRLNLLEKLEREATTGENPAFEIEFQGVHPPKRYVVLPGWLYDYYARLAGNA